MTVSSYHPGLTTDNSPGVQLPQADIAKATQPGLFDDLPESAFTVDHKILVNARPADRMLACLALPVSNAAKIVAAAVAYHGWSSWPSRETLGRLTDLKLQNVSRALKELENAGVVVRKKRFHSGGAVGMQTTFDGPSMAEAVAHQGHPVLEGAGINMIRADSVATSDVTAKQPCEELRGNHIDSRAGINMRPEPEVTEPEGVTLIDGYQSNSGYSDFTSGFLGHRHAHVSASSSQVCPACGVGDCGLPACYNCGLVHKVPSTAPERGEWPAWYVDLAAKVDANILPGLRWIDEARMLAGWTDEVMTQAAATYAKVYQGKTVNAPLELFKKLAVQAARIETGKRTPAKTIPMRRR